MGKTTSRTTSRVCLQTKSSHTAIGQFCIRIICRSCTINVVRSPSTGPFGVNLNCLRINTEILKCPIPLWTDLDSDHLHFCWTVSQCAPHIQVCGRPARKHSLPVLSGWCGEI